MGYIKDACAKQGLSLQAIAPRGLYRPAIRHGDMLYLSGQVSRLGEETIAGPALASDLERGQLAARTAALRALSVLDAALGVGERVRVLKLTGYVMSEPDFTQHSAVIDGASQVLVAVLGEDAGAHARTAVGVASLPSSGMVELDLVCVIERA
ncbi:enamine deaminase RidA (YjgF/YER057c/UK114 family) [Devosia sp. UYZn731]|uniref:RidA family protein n=1 Tax=Devosia sp. UYZn731 TaxID=3156345 RepID=UPI0033912255